VTHLAGSFGASRTSTEAECETALVESTSVVSHDSGRLDLEESAMGAWTKFVLGSVILFVSATQIHAEVSPTDVARDYFLAMDAGELDDAEALFAKQSSIFETGGAEGTWDHYREHHIGPELDAFESFETTLGDPEEDRSTDGSMAFVAWPIRYRIELKDQTVIESKGTVTFVFVKDDDKYRIRHLHWSSRKVETKKD
jgi:hypothetical protein